MDAIYELATLVALLGLTYGLGYYVTKWVDTLTQ